MPTLTSAQFIKLIDPSEAVISKPVMAISTFAKVVTEPSDDVKATPLGDSILSL